MAPFEYTRTVSHPYHKTSPKTHGHFRPTQLRFPAYAAPGVPYRWMAIRGIDEFRTEYQIDADVSREPDLGFKPKWVQHRDNHRALLDCFSDHVRPDQSLYVFYAKQVPFVEDARRVLIGVGRVKHVGPATEYQYATADPPLRSLLWERMVQHSIPPDFADGFLLPYHQALAHTAEHPEFDPASVVAFAPGDRPLEFSYATEHVTHDGAIASLLSCAAALREAANHLPGPWDRCLRWLDDRLGELWQARGPYPGLGAALCAFGIDLGVFVAYEIAGKVAENEDPWPLVAQAIESPKAVLSAESARQIGKTLQEAWKRLSPERGALLRLISRFDITPDQARHLYVAEERAEASLRLTDRELLENPYRICEATRLSADPISVWTVNRGVFPDPVVREKHPLPEPSACDGPTDARRVRALTIHLLEDAAANGHTLVSRGDTILKIRRLELRPASEVTGDLMGVAEAGFPPEIRPVSLDDGSPAFQLDRLARVGEVIRTAVQRRRGGKRLEVAAEWRPLLDKALGPMPKGGDEREERARREKAAALKELAESRFSVLIGPAGTGKTTLLAVLCAHPQIAAGGVLLLAPTGKARVRMEQAARKKDLPLRGFTIAQFLRDQDRYDPDTSRYSLSDAPPFSKDKDGKTYDTVIVDEASMLTEEMLGALLDAIRGAKRIILVGATGSFHRSARAGRSLTSSRRPPRPTSRSGSRGSRPATPN